MNRLYSFGGLVGIPLTTIVLTVLLPFSSRALDRQPNTNNHPATNKLFSPAGLTVLKNQQPAPEAPDSPAGAPILIAQLTADPDCEYYADDDEPVNNEVLSITNIGNATLTYAASIVYTLPAAPPQHWMQFIGLGQTIPPDNIPQGGATKQYGVQMSKGTLANGLYQAGGQPSWYCSDYSSKMSIGGPPFMVGEHRLWAADLPVCPVWYWAGHTGTCAAHEPVAGGPP